MQKSMNVSVLICVSLYLLAVVLANGLVTLFGQSALPFTAFVLIPFDLLARDVLHEKWKKDQLWFRMTLLILSGSLMSYVTSIASARVSLASAISFLLCGFSNAVIYHLLDSLKFNRMIRMNGSNAVAAVVDSIVFPCIAFSSVIMYLSFAQAVSKFIGGLVWTLLFLSLIKWRRQSDSNNKED